MCVLIIHLSDIHIENEEDLILKETQKIVDAIVSVTYSKDLTDCIVIVSGDIANKGYEEQYIHAMGFFEDIELKLTSRLKKVKYHFIAVPGNHDCDFLSDQSVRNIILENIEKNQKNTQHKLISECCKIQNNFFKFLKCNETNNGIPIDEEIPELAYEYIIQTNSDKKIKILCLNTAWMSKISEKPGTMYFPDNYIKQRETEDVHITVHHHPYNWFMPDPGRSLRQKIESISDLVLTGHEHDDDVRLIKSKSGSQTHIEGGPLYTRGLPSTFGVILLDIEKENFIHITFKSNGNIYEPNKQVIEDEWSSLVSNKLKSNKNFKISNKFERELEDIGVSITRHSSNTMNLKDIFVYPALQEFSLSLSKSIRHIDYLKVFETIKNNKKVFITGDTESGKTTLLKSLFKRFNSEKYVSLLLNKDVKVSNEPQKEIERLFRLQYEVHEQSKITEYFQLDISKKVILIDDYHKINKSKESKRLINYLVKFAGIIIITANDFYIDVTNNITPYYLDDEFKYFRIQPFGYLQRDDLIKNWIFFDPEAVNEQSALKKMRQLSSLFDTLIGSNFVPAYPVYLLAVLQADDVSSPINTRTSTHAYFYEIFIKIALSQNATSEDFDVIMAYLAYVAYQFFSKRLVYVEEGTFEKIHNDYTDCYAIHRPFNDMKKKLIERQIVSVNNDTYKFKYNYLYYYFVAAYLRDHLSENDIKDHVKRLIEKIYHTEYANILLFLAHLSKDPVIVDTMCESAKTIFSKTSPINFDDDVMFINELGATIKKLPVLDIDPESERRNRLNDLDEIESKENDMALAPITSPGVEEMIEVENDIISDFNKALKTLQILGQLIKNFPGHFEKTTKNKILTECYLLSRRILGHYFNLVRSEDNNILLEIVNMLKKENKEKISDDELKKKAKKFMLLFMRLAAFGVIRRTSIAVGSSELTISYKQILESDSSPANKLINVSIELDQSEKIPFNEIKDLCSLFEKSVLGMWVLQDLAVERMYLFTIPIDKKQKLCDLLHLEVGKTVSSTARKMISE